MDKTCIFYRYKRRYDNQVWPWKQRERRAMEINSGKGPSREFSGQRTQSIVSSGREVVLPNLCVSNYLHSDEALE